MKGPLIPGTANGGGCVVVSGSGNRGNPPGKLPNDGEAGAPKSGVEPLPTGAVGKRIAPP